MNVYNAKTNPEKFFIIKSISCDKATKSRLNSLGVCERAKIKIYHKSLSGVVLICDGMQIALCRKLAQLVEVQNL